QAGNPAPRILDGAQENVRTATALHALQGCGRGMLQRYVDVGTDLLVSRDGIEQFAGNFVRIGIEKPNPAEPLDSGKLVQQQRQAILQAKVLPVAGRVLADE